jgi:peptidoglycan/LPS O-acetylase OafA/YrhL
VLLLHSSIWGAVPEIFPGGNLGVTVFFVLSGYLITTLLLDEHAGRGTIDLRAFYIRRAARLLPGLLVLLPVYVLVFSRAQSPSELLLTVGAALLYVSSFVQAIWGAMGNLSWTWSLSVEEHFYAFWPPLLRWLLGNRHPRDAARRRPRASIAWLRRRPLTVASAVAVAIGAAAVVLRITLTGSTHWNDFGYYSTVTRLDALAAGCLAAMYGHRHRVRLPAPAGWAAVAVIGWCYLNPDFTIGRAALDLYGLPVCTLASAVLVMAVVERPEGILGRVLSFRPLVGLGAVSYGLYLWNLMPGQTFHLLSGHHPGPLGTVGLAAIMFIVVGLSYVYVERPVQRWAKARLAGADPRSRRASRRRLRPRPLGSEPPLPAQHAGVVRMQAVARLR